MSIITITSENFNKQVTQLSAPILLDFYADWCGPCRMVGPLLEEIANENPSAKIGKINVDKEPELAAKFSVSSIPTLIVIENGEVKTRTMGAKSKRELLQLIQ